MRDALLREREALVDERLARGRARRSRDARSARRGAGGSGRIRAHPVAAQARRAPAGVSCARGSSPERWWSTGRHRPGRGRRSTTRRVPGSSARVRRRPRGDPDRKSHRVRSGRWRRRGRAASRRSAARRDGEAIAVAASGSWISTDPTWAALVRRWPFRVGALAAARRARRRSRRGRGDPANAPSDVVVSERLTVLPWTLVLAQPAERDAFAAVKESGAALAVPGAVPRRDRGRVRVGRLAQREAAVGGAGRSDRAHRRGRSDASRCPALGTRRDRAPRPLVRGDAAGAGQGRDAPSPAAQGDHGAGGRAQADRARAARRDVPDDHGAQDEARRRRDGATPRRWRPGASTSCTGSSTTCARPSSTTWACSRPSAGWRSATSRRAASRSAASSRSRRAAPVRDRDRRLSRRRRRRSTTSSGTRRPRRC